MDKAKRKMAVIKAFMILPFLWYKNLVAFTKKQGILVLVKYDFFS